MGDYRPDFLCRAARVDVEADGPSHRGREADDAVRDAWFATQGITALRFTAEQVERDVGGVVAHVNRWCLQRVGAPELLAPVALLPQHANEERATTVNFSDRGSLVAMLVW